MDGKFSMSGTPVLNTSDVQTYYWETSGGVTRQSLVDFMNSCKKDCAFLVMIRGTGYPFVGMGVGSVCIEGQYGAATLYDYHNGAQSFRLFGGVVYTQ